MRTAIALSVLVAGSANAEIVSGAQMVLPDVVIGSVAQSIQELSAIDERSDVTLTEDLVLGDTTIAAGTVVSSTLIVFDPDDWDRVEADIMFAGEILAIIGDVPTLNATNGLFGPEGYSYDFPGVGGIESSDIIEVTSANSLYVNLVARQLGDHFRVLTASPIPAPSAAALMGLGLITAGRRRG